jgi:ferrous iron transport protein A
MSSTNETTESAAALTSLDLLPVGAHARIVELHGGREMIRRLLSLGLRVGSEIEVVQHRGRGVVVASHGVRVALGAGVAAKMQMQPVESGLEA